MDILTTMDQSKIDSPFINSPSQKSFWHRPINFFYGALLITIISCGVTEFILNRTNIIPLQEMTSSQTVAMVHKKPVMDCKKEDGRVRCNLNNIAKDDTFRVGIGHDIVILFTYTGTAPVKDKYFDFSQNEAWSYKMEGSTDSSKKITMIIGNDSKHLGFSFLDLNYDGYLDLLDSGGCGGMPYLCAEGIYFFDPIRNIFYEDDTIYNLGENDDLNIENKTWGKFYMRHTTTDSYQNKEQYVFTNNKWTLTSYTKVTTINNNTGCNIEKGLLVNGKMKKNTSTVKIDPNDEGDICANLEI